MLEILILFHPDFQQGRNKCGFGVKNDAIRISLDVLWRMKIKEIIIFHYGEKKRVTWFSINPCVNM